MARSGNRFVISDTHFGHAGVCKFLRADGVTKLRPWDSPEEMDAALIQNWNDVVRPTDTVYHLGDVAINRRAISTLKQLNGRKILIKGNHDIFKLKDYVEYFEDIRGYCVTSSLVILSHIPIHERSKSRFIGNIHGHLHANCLDDPWYQNVSVEQIDYRPVPLEDIIARFSANQ